MSKHERTVRMVQEQRREYPSLCAAIESMPRKSAACRRL